MMVLVMWEHCWLGEVAVVVGGPPPIVIVFCMRSGDSRNCCTVRLLDPSKVTPERGRDELTSDWLMSVRKAMLLCPWAPEKARHSLGFYAQYWNRFHSLIDVIALYLLLLRDFL